MKKNTFSSAIAIKKSLYLFPVLFLCISLQSIATTQLKTENIQSETEVSSAHENDQADQNNKNTHTAFDLTLTRKQKAKTNQPAGTLDSDFGRNGQGYFIGKLPIPRLDFGFDYYTRGIAIQPNDRIVVAGTIDVFTGDTLPILTRFAVDGELDGTFGHPTDGGSVLFGLTKNGYFNIVAIQQFDQKIVAVGGSIGKRDDFLVRYNTNGDLDRSFNGRGYIQPSINSNINAMAIQQKDHKILVSYSNPSNPSNDQALLMRYLGNGSIDNSFGTGGTLSVKEGKLSQINAINVQEDKKIVVVGKVNVANKNEIAVARYNEQGALDLLFGSEKNGLERIQVGNGETVPYGVASQSNGKIVVVGSSISKFNKSIFTIIRLNKDGLRDTSFGNNGVITITPTGYTGDNAYATSVALDNDDNIIVMGYTVATNNYTYFSLVRYTKDGALDAHFGDQGIKNTSLSSAKNAPNKNRTPVVGAIQNNHKKVALASNYSSTDSTTSDQLAVARYNN